jgi:predicted outer membrane repeat protein
VTGSYNATLDGFVVGPGSATSAPPNDRGAGIYNSPASPKISNCIIRYNNSSYGGSGMFNSNSSPEVSGCTFYGNTTGGSGGGVFNENSSPAITNSTFSLNSAGGGIRGGGGMHNTGGAPLVTNCVFSGNLAARDGGAMRNESSTVRVTNSVFEGNRANDEGGAIYNDSATLTIRNATFHGNSAADTGGAIRNSDSSQSDVANSIVWANQPNAMSNSGGSAATVGFSNVEGGAAGDGNIDGDPRFANTPVATGFTSSPGSTTTLQIVNATNDFDTGDIIEISDDGKKRTVTGVSGTTVTFTPALDNNTITGMRVDKWKGNDLDVDLRIGAKSACIDAADDAVAPYGDIEGRGRVDIEPSDSDEGYADMGVHEFDGEECNPIQVYENAYYWVACEPLKWSKAEKLCAHHGGHLVSISSAAENRYVRGLVESRCWIGANDRDQEGSWAWSDARSWNYENWNDDTSQPDGADEENCGTISSRTGLWSDVPCGDERLFVCKSP